MPNDPEVPGEPSAPQSAPEPEAAAPQPVDPFVDASVGLAADPAVAASLATDLEPGTPPPPSTHAGTLDSVVATSLATDLDRGQASDALRRTPVPEAGSTPVPEAPADVPEPVVAAEPVPEPLRQAGPPLLRTHGLRRAFGKFEAVRGVSLELSAGQIYGFLGRNGAGKTTTLRMLIGVLRPDAGEIELLGERGNRVRPSQRSRIGYLSQEQVFYPWMTALQLGQFMSGFYKTWDPAEFDRLLRLLDVPKDRKARFLSGGTKAKLGLALALSHRPSLLILDEPTAGLDPVARREFLDILASQIRREGQAVLFSSHLVSEVQQVCDRIGILQDGQLRFQGALSELLETHRRVVLPAEAQALTQGAEVIRAEPQPDGRIAAVLRGDSAFWAGEAVAAAGPSALTLEEIFLAYARQGPRA